MNEFKDIDLVSFDTSHINEILVCIDCYQFIATKELNLELSIKNASEIVGNIEIEWPFKRYKLEVAEQEDIHYSSDECKCCKNAIDGPEFIINIYEVN